MRRFSGLIGAVVAAALVLGACSNSATPSEPGAVGIVPMRWEPVSNAFPDAHALVETITAGWNLGDTLDSNVGQAPASIRHNTPQRQETFWENQITTEENILTVRNAGFNAIRIPVTWFAMVDDNLHIRGDWLDRVQTVVDYAYENGMIVILNTHHDESMWSLFDADRPKSRAVIETVWQQIATRFSGYSQRLIFEGLNEPRTVGSADEWSGGTEEERNNVNILNQVFVDTVRATGGNNANRFLITSPYAASATAPAIEGFVLPTDPAGTNQIIVSIHMYEPYPFAHSMNGNVVNEWSADGVGPGGPDAIVDGLERAFHTFVERGVPVIFGEMGALNRDNQDSRVAWAQFYVEQARLREMRTFWWDNGGIGLTLPGIAQFGLFDRRTNQATQPELIAAIMSAVDATP
ncbi:MAG: glycoside hydrolase family 5 protein [Cellulomonadaceae bacterium]|nr:glycoside hydrolase family 5 protein [Cellulomonadaceae bacterium]